MNSYKTINAFASDEITEKKSRFIGYIKPVKTENEALEFIADPNDWKNKKTMKVNLSVPKFDVSSNISLIDGLKAGKSKDYYSYFKTKISESLGCSFAHYLFYKLEYMLWKTEDEDRKERWQNYRITSKNSIEHIFPQNPKFPPPYCRPVPDAK